MTGERTARAEIEGEEVLRGAPQLQRLIARRQADARGEAVHRREIEALDRSHLPGGEIAVAGESDPQRAVRGNDARGGVRQPPDDVLHGPQYVFAQQIVGDGLRHDDVGRSGEVGANLEVARMLGHDPDAVGMAVALDDPRRGGGHGGIEFATHHFGRARPGRHQGEKARSCADVEDSGTRDDAATQGVVVGCVARRVREDRVVPVRHAAFQDDQCDSFDLGVFGGEPACLAHEFDGPFRLAALDQGLRQPHHASRIGGEMGRRLGCREALKQHRPVLLDDRSGRMVIRSPVATPFSGRKSRSAARTAAGGCRRTMPCSRRSSACGCRPLRPRP